MRSRPFRESSSSWGVDGTPCTCRRSRPVIPSLAIGLRVKVPWSVTGSSLRIAVELQDADGARLLPGGQVVHAVNISRRSGKMDRADIGLVRSFTFNNLQFENQGDYSFVISIDEEIATRLRFSVRTRR